MLILFATSLLLFIHHGQCAIQAMANIKLHNTSQSIGILWLVQNDANSPIRITGTLSSLTASSSLGFHVHTTGVSDDMPNCIAADGHFNPYNTVHGSPTNDLWHRHVGDLGNITTNTNGTAMVNIADSIIQFYNLTQSITNRTIVIHQMFDDGGLGSGTSNVTGNAGARVACGVIRIMPSDGLNIQPATSMLFLTIILTVMMLFY